MQGTNAGIRRRRIIGVGLAGLFLDRFLGITDALPQVRATVGHPTDLRIPKVGTDAPIEVRTTVNGTMQDPTGPWVVAWYDDSGFPGSSGNAVFAGHESYAGVGSAVFADLDLLTSGDHVDVTGGDGIIYRYQMTWSRIYPGIGGPWFELTGPTDKPSVTLITCAPPVDPATGLSLQRLVVRAELDRS